MSGTPPTGVQRESPYSSPYWNQASLELKKRAFQRRNSGAYADAARLYQQGFDEARRVNDPLAAVKFLISVGGCQLLDFRYRDAVASFLQAREMAVAIRDREDAGAIAVNLANVYQQIWDIPAALSAAEEGLADAQPNSYFMPQLLLTLGRLHAMGLHTRGSHAMDALGNGGASAAPYFAESIEASRRAGNEAVEALGWDLLGEQQLDAGEFDAAERSLGEAYRLRVLSKRPDVGYSYGLLGALRLATRDLSAAERFTALAIHAAEKGAPAWPLYRLIHQRGAIRMAEGRTEAALLDFSSAVEKATAWRAELLPARSSLTATNIALENQIFGSFIRAAASESLRTRDPRWAARAFEALETNRAASLRESVALADAWKEKLPPEYWETLGRLGAVQARAATGTTSTNDEAGRLALKLTEMEALAGIRFTFKKGENFRTQSSLNHFQKGLGDSELFLSFALGDQESYLWAVSRAELRLYRIAGRERIAEEVRTFREAVRKDDAEVAARGERLYQTLFGQLSERESGKQAWLLSVEGALFDLPFAALVPERHLADTVYLVERHSLQIVPGATLLGAPEVRTGNGGWLLGIGDPIYNAADPRWTSGAPKAAGLGAGLGPVGGSAWVPSWLRAGLLTNRGFGNGGSPAGQLGRLVGSAQEVESVAQVWRAEAGTATILEGADARRETFRGMLGRHPSVIHLATHVVSGVAHDQTHEQISDRGSREQSFVAFGLGERQVSDGPSAEFLSTSEIGGLRVPGALVVMTGCDSGSGDAQAGAGLLGLTRAWLMAGARAVVATSWPVEDSSGEIFSDFYHRLPRQGAAEALRMSQIRMVQSGAWHGKPSYWASYLLVGGGR